MTAITMSAQRDLGLEILKYGIKYKSHSKGSYVVYTNENFFYEQIPNEKGISEENEWKRSHNKDTLSVEEAMAANERLNRELKSLVASIRNTLDSLMETANESYHFETHTKDADTIKYSICLETNKNNPNIKADDWEYPDTTENLIFEYHTQKNEEGKKVFCNIKHKRIEYADQAKETFFDKDKYNGIIHPILNREGVKSWNFTWEINNAKYAPKSEDWNGLEGNSKTNLKHYQKGTMFFIPLKDKALAYTLIDELCKATEDYLARNGNQLYRYEPFQMTFVLDRPNRPVSRSILMAPLDPSNSSYKEIDFNVFIGATQDGYYIYTLENSPTRLRPKEIFKLKSIINGKKEYVK